MAQRAWWRTELDKEQATAAERAKQRAAEQQMLRLQQNAWLSRHAKQPRFEFSGKQKRMLRRWFDALDTDGSGKISVEELEDPMLSIGVVSDPSEIQGVVSKLDKDANSMIDFHEFVEFLTPHSKQKIGGSPEKHEAMFRQLTEKMEHQSAGYLEINTQLSMERRRFILDAITKRSGQSVQEDLADICHRKKSRLPSTTEALSASPTYFSSDVANLSSSEQFVTGSALERAIERKNKLAALADRQRSEVRFQALERVLTRNLKKLEPIKQGRENAGTTYSQPSDPLKGARRDMLTPIAHVHEELHKKADDRVR